MSTLAAAVALALPLDAAAGTGEDGPGASATAPARAAIEDPVIGDRSAGLPFTAVDLALLLGGAAAVVGLGSGSRRLLRERA